jgi:large subunit ribosomal protein L21
MYAIIKTGGKQYTVKPGDVVRVEKLEAELGSELNMKDVLMVGGDKTFVGENLGNAVVTVVVTNQQRGPKVIIFKKKRRQGYRRTGGHRQPFTEIFVKSITSPEGQIEKAENKPHVFSPEKRAARIAKTAELRLQAKQNAHKNPEAKAERAESTKAKPAAKKASAKKAAPKKKTGAKKAAGSKTAAKKAAQKSDKKSTKK